MLKSHTAGRALDSPTPAQLKEFFSQIEKGKITKDGLQAFLRDDFAISTPTVFTEAERLALEILGESRVLGCKDVCRVWQRDLPEVEPALFYTEEILAQAAERNRSDENWRLVWCNGISLRDQLAIMGDNREKQPCFDKDYKWWRESAQDEWATKPVEAGYRLLDFSCDFTSRNLQEQNDAITSSGEQFARAKEQAVAEACFSNYLMNGKERLLQGRYHWGFLRSAAGYLVCVGFFDGLGFHVHSCWDDDVLDVMGVVRVWKYPCPS